jgi:hypothetical protein
LTEAFFSKNVKIKQLKMSAEFHHSKFTKLHLDAINILFDLEKRLSRLGVEDRGIERNLERMHNVFEHQYPEGSLTWHNPIGETYADTRTDCDADIAGSKTSGLIITEVIKPVVYFEPKDGTRVIVQKAVVIAA